MATGKVLKNAIKIDLTDLVQKVLFETHIKMSNTEYQSFLANFKKSIDLDINENELRLKIKTKSLV